VYGAGAERQSNCAVDVEVAAKFGGARQIEFDGPLGPRLGGGRRRNLLSSVQMHSYWNRLAGFFVHDVDSHFAV
jgi:hypothetical protein